MDPVPVRYLYLAGVEDPPTEQDKNLKGDQFDPRAVMVWSPLRVMVYLYCMHDVPLLSNMLRVCMNQ